MKRILFVICGVVAATAAAAQQYSGRILDAESSAPIAGAIVIAAIAVVLTVYMMVSDSKKKSA